jgi:hypothetical protein
MQSGLTKRDRIVFSLFGVPTPPRRSAKPALHLIATANRWKVDRDHLPIGSPVTSANVVA